MWQEIQVCGRKSSYLVENLSTWYDFLPCGRKCNHISPFLCGRKFNHMNVRKSEKVNILQFNFQVLFTQLILIWAHLFDISQSCFLKCLLILSAWIDAKSHWSQLFDFLHCESSNASSYCQLVLMQSRTGRTCLIFLPKLSAWIDAKSLNFDFLKASSIVCIRRCEAVPFS